MNIPAEEPTLGDAIFEMGVALSRFNAQVEDMSKPVSLAAMTEAELMLTALYDDDVAERRKAIRLIASLRYLEGHNDALRAAAGATGEGK